MVSPVYFIFFLSGASALIYEIVWTRYLSLVFGGSHLAVTTVLTVFMAGLALGSYTIGKNIGGQTSLLRIFGFLELGTGILALFFAGMMQVYPSFYRSLAQIAPDSPVYLTVIRILFAIVAIIAPTTLMGGTLPVLTGFASRLQRETGKSLSFLYGSNTLGAVCGAAATGFVMLRNFSMGKTLFAAMALNFGVGLAAIVLQGRAETLATVASEPLSTTKLPPTGDIPSFSLILWGIGISGFCAMAYEVLWGRILSIVIGASTYGFTLLLMAFLSGIGTGSMAYGLVSRLRRRHDTAPSWRTVALFGGVQMAIGGFALLSSSQFRHLPTYTALLHDRFLAMFPAVDQFQVIQLANFILAFSIMFVPAFFMGVAFPLAGEIHARYRLVVGHAVGEILSYNTIGAILGAGVSGYLLIYLCGIQRSLQIIIILNCGYGLVLICRCRWGRHAALLATLAALAVLLLPLCYPTAWQLWEPKLYAIYQSNKPEEYGTTEEMRELLSNMDVRYYAEGAQAIVSAVQSADILFFITNGRVEASNTHHDMQCQYVLGHLPMLLHPAPRSVFVLGTGSGMTLGAVSVHPGVQRITLAEIEPKVLGVARTFGVDNHYVLNKPDPRLKIVFNDGRNHLLTTTDRYDVITADPVHPWFNGAGYLYSTEYFHLAAQRLNPGGILCQWLPLYELTGDDLRSVVRTIGENFAYLMIWVTHYDAEIVASNSPLVIDEQALERRISFGDVKQDLRQIKMGSARDFLSFFVMGTEGARAYSRTGRLNTDDNLYLEFSAPRSIGLAHLRAANLADLLGHRESIIPYLRLQPEASARAEALRSWEENYRAALLADKAHVLDMNGDHLSYQYSELAAELENRYPRYAPWRYEKDEADDGKGGQPEMIRQQELPLRDEHDQAVTALFAAVRVRTGKNLTRIFFIDDATRTVFGKLRFKGAVNAARTASVSEEIMQTVRTIYAEAVARAAAEGKSQPSVLDVFPKIKTAVEMRVDRE